MIRLTTWTCSQIRQNQTPSTYVFEARTWGDLPAQRACFQPPPDQNTCQDWWLLRRCAAEDNDRANTRPPQGCPPPKNGALSMSAESLLLVPRCSSRNRSSPWPVMVRKREHLRAQPSTAKVVGIGHWGRATAATYSNRSWRG